MKHTETQLNILNHSEKCANMSSNIQISRLCDYCGNSFIAKTTVTRICSKTCNSRFYKRKKREEKMIKSHIETQNKIIAPSTNSLTVDKPFLNINV